MPSRCPSCSRERDAFICTTCLTKLLRLYKTQISSHDSLLPAAEARAKAGIKLVRQNVEHEAEHWKRKAAAQTILRQTDELKSRNSARREAIQHRRHAFAARQARLTSVKAALQAASATEESPIRSPVPTVPLPTVYKALEAQASLQAELTGVVDELAKTRQILLQELLEVFDVQECSIPGCRYQIGSLPVPSLPELQDLPKQQLNASIGLLVSLIQLAAKYLGIQLPFLPQNTVLKPLIRALPISMAAQRFSKAYPLYMSTGGSSSSSASMGTESPSAPHQGFGAPASTPSTSAVKSATPATHAQALVTGLTMLAYDAFYLHQLSASGADDAPTEPTLDDGDVDILFVLKRISKATSTGRLSHVLNGSHNTVRDVESISPAVNFEAFLNLLELRKQSQPKSASGAVTRTKERKKGKYVVVSHTDPKREGISSSAQKQETSTEDESWDVL